VRRFCCIQGRHLDGDIGKLADRRSVVSQLALNATVTNRS
jgi:hypothetical protein